MRMMLAAVPMMMSCAPVPPADVPPAEAPPALPDGGAPCNADGLGDLLGRPASQDLGAQAMRRSGAHLLRWIRPGDAVTMDYSEHRLNIMLDQRGRVQEFTCG